MNSAAMLSPRARQKRSWPCRSQRLANILSGRKKIEIPPSRREPDGRYLSVFGARENNLKKIDVHIPLGLMTCITGVSGSGKSSLVNGILLKKLASDLNGARRFAGAFDRVEGLEYLDKVISIDQSPIGRTPRSNPATYTGMFDHVRELFASTPGCPGSAATRTAASASMSKAAAVKPAAVMG